ncbi:hypothetical protein BMF29_03290 [Comamonas kerstersii]|nr:hypothetical protein BMF38_14095 [Comamonas kerstersii]OOH95058.1 hypothetical protein BMF29_03290 [Comamonas kerstersii]
MLQSAGLHKDSQAFVTRPVHNGQSDLQGCSMSSSTSLDTHAPRPPAATLQRWQHLCGDQALVCLHLFAHSSQVLIYAQPHGSDAPVALQLPLGLDLLAQQVFGNRMPNEAQLEHGIMLVEDTIMPVATQIPAHSMLLLNDRLLHAVGRSALGRAQAHTHSVRREAVETLFNLLVMQAMHPQVPIHDVPQTPQAAAALLILREVLHHWQLESVLLDDQPSG